MGDLVPVVNPDDIAALPAEQRGAVITQALTESKSWLAVATQATDPTPIAEFKAWAATVAEMTRQKGLAEDIQLDALEMVRRAERGIGVVIRKGQEAGEILKHGEVGNGRPQVEIHGQEFYKRRPTEAAQVDHPSRLSPLYEVTDGISDEQFDEAIEEAREERNLTRANVVRKVQGIATGRLSRYEKSQKIKEMAAEGYTSRQMESALATSPNTIREIARAHGIDIPADRVTTRTKQIDPERVIQETVNTLQGIEYGLGLLGPADYDAFTPEQVRAWLGALSTPYRAVRGLMKELNDRAR